MSELDYMIDSPIGALFFVSGAISVFVALAILILRKGTESHSILGYLYFFGLGFTNYAEAMAYYKNLLPLSAVLISVPISTFFLLLGITTILSKSKSKFRITLHIISMLISISAFAFGIVTKWYHFQVKLLNLFQWSDLRAVLMLSLPIFVIGFLLILHFLGDGQKIFLQYSNPNAKNVRKRTETLVTAQQPIATEARQNSEVIYQTKAADMATNHRQESL